MTRDVVPKVNNNAAPYELSIEWRRAFAERRNLKSLGGKQDRGKQRRKQNRGAHVGHLTVKLRGRPEAPAKRRGRILSSGARGAEPPTRHGPLQRLLGPSRAKDHDQNRQQNW